MWLDSLSPYPRLIQTWDKIVIKPFLDKTTKGRDQRWGKRTTVHHHHLSAPNLGENHQACHGRVYHTETSQVAEITLYTSLILLHFVFPQANLNRSVVSVISYRFKLCHITVPKIHTIQKPVERGISGTWACSPRVQLHVSDTSLSYFSLPNLTTFLI
jgi:hypothetical protein